MKDKSLLHCLPFGVGFLHEMLSPGDQAVVNTLFSSGAIQVSLKALTFFLFY